MGPWTVKESAVTSVFRANNFYYPVEVTTEVSPPLTSFPWIKPSNFLGAMSKMNDLDHLLGGLSLKESRGRLVNFWEKYRRLYPQHQLWQQVDSGQKEIQSCIPVLLHGDEGVTYKKNGLLVLSFQGVIGHGCGKRVVHDNLRAQSDGVPLNFLRTGFQTRLLICVCPKDLSVVVFPSN